MRAYADDAATQHEVEKETPADNTNLSDYAEWYEEEILKYDYMKKILTCLFAALGLTTACGQQNFENMEVKEFAELIADSNVVILDVRKADEFAEEHIKGAILIDQFQSDFLEQSQAKLLKDKTIAVYCRSGRRSANAAGKLAEVGYKCVNLKGGILAWKEANMPVVTSVSDTM